MRHQKKSVIDHITRAGIHHYSDNGQVTAYVDWVDTNGHTGRTTGPMHVNNTHMRALLDRAKREGVEIENIST